MAPLWDLQRNSLWLEVSLRNSVVKQMVWNRPLHLSTYSQSINFISKGFFQAVNSFKII